VRSVAVRSIVAVHRSAECVSFRRWRHAAVVKLSGENSTSSARHMYLWGGANRRLAAAPAVATLAWLQLSQLPAPPVHRPRAIHDDEMTLTAWLLAAWLLTAWLLAAWLLTAWLLAAWLLTAWPLAAWLLTAWLLAAWLLAAWLLAAWLLAACCLLRGLLMYITRLNCDKCIARDKHARGRWCVVAERGGWCVLQVGRSFAMSSACGGGSLLD
jgi:hypothetical protein